MLKQRVITALILGVLLLGALFGLPRAGWAAVVLAIVVIGAAEWGPLSKLPRAGSMIYAVLTLALMAALAWLHLYDSASSHQLDKWIDGAAAVFWLVIAPAWLGGGWRVENRLLMALVGWLVLIPMGLAMLDLRAYSPWLLLGVMALVWIADTAAYFAGRRFGKHKLAPAISPGKTWEGVAGALAGVSLYVFIVYAAQSLWGRGHAVAFPGIFVLGAWLWVALSIEGDLFESAIKRQAGVKDSGKLLPGHGGLLDRIDALTSTLPLAALVLLVQKTTL